MKLSLKFQDEDENQYSTQIMTAKVPITIFNNPFTSGLTATTATDSVSEFAFSLATNFPSGPSLKLSYSPTIDSLPFSLSLKSGLGVLGSPRHSPLVFSATFSLSNSLSPLPSFFLHFKPQSGNFSLNKTVFSDPNTHHDPTPPPSLDIGKGFLPEGSSLCWQDLKLEPCGATTTEQTTDHNCSVPEKKRNKYGVSNGVGVMAKSVMPVMKGFFLNFRWGVHFPGNLAEKLPYLTLNKIALERVEEVKESDNNNDNKNSNNGGNSDLQLLKGICYWMRRDLEVVEKENREMKRVLDEMKTGVSGSNGVGKKLSEGSGEFQRWRSNKRQEEEKKQQNKSQSVASDVESELQKAIKAATS
ncbi:hypothetical protein RJT34_05573 [Clitoria ternatea]|uniref:Uncharacterized protein n=1 Tax=Clitoria ternatea TaxID=43366 RepID=A0AAN9K2B9_CLITE